jgi:hypothetical protein
MTYHPICPRCGCQTPAGECHWCDLDADDIAAIYADRQRLDRIHDWAVTRYGNGQRAAGVIQAARRRYSRRSDRTDPTPQCASAELRAAMREFGVI